MLLERVFEGMFKGALEGVDKCQNRPGGSYDSTLPRESDDAAATASTPADTLID